VGKRLLLYVRILTNGLWIAPVARITHRRVSDLDRPMTILILAIPGTHRLSTNAPLPNVALRLNWLVLRLRRNRVCGRGTFPSPQGLTELRRSLLRERRSG
jgi:hypothetical protein